MNKKKTTEGVYRKNKYIFLLPLAPAVTDTVRPAVRQTADENRQLDIAIYKRCYTNQRKNQTTGGRLIAWT